MFAIQTARVYVQHVLSSGTGDSSDDALIAQIADGVSERIEKVTGRYFVKRTGLTLWQGPPSADRRRRFLRYIPVVSVDSFSINGISLAENVDYTVDLTSGLVELFTHHFPHPNPAFPVVVSYTAGFDVQDGPALPADIYQAGLDYLKFAYSRSIANGLSSGTVRIGGTEATFVPAPPKDILATIQTWADPRA